MRSVIPVKKLSNSFELPSYGMGLWRKSYKSGIDEEEDRLEISAIEAALELGVTHFDTAELYGNGHSETILGQTIKGLDRSALFLASKVTAANQSAPKLLASLEASLLRLGTDYLDVYMLHSYPNEGTDIAEVMQTLDSAVSQGLIRAIGVSNFSPERFTRAQACTDQKIVCNQVHYNLQVREAEHRRVVAQCQEEDILLTAWRPLQYGVLAESEFLAGIAEKHNKTPSQVAISWLTSQMNVVTICKTNNIDHLKSNIDAATWVMPDEDIELIRREFPNQLQISNSVPL